MQRAKLKNNVADFAVHDLAFRLADLSSLFSRPFLEVSGFSVLTSSFLKLDSVKSGESLYFGVLGDCPSRSSMASPFKENKEQVVTDRPTHVIAVSMKNFRPLCKTLDHKYYHHMEVVVSNIIITKGMYEMYGNFKIK